MAIVSAPGDYDNEEIGGMIGRGNRSTRKKPAPVQLCPPQNPHAALTRTRAAAVGSQRLTAELLHGLSRRKPAQVPLCSQQTPHAARTLTLAAAVGSQRLTA
jgi:hypothetical protein